MSKSEAAQMEWRFCEFSGEAKLSYGHNYSRTLLGQISRHCQRLCEAVFERRDRRISLDEDEEEDGDDDDDDYLDYKSLQLKFTVFVLSVFLKFKHSKKFSDAFWA